MSVTMLASQEAISPQTVLWVSALCALACFVMAALCAGLLVSAWGYAREASRSELRAEQCAVQASEARARAAGAAGLAPKTAPSATPERQGHSQRDLGYETLERMSKGVGELAEIEEAFDRVMRADAGIGARKRAYSEAEAQASREDARRFAGNGAV